MVIIYTDNGFLNTNTIVPKYLYLKFFLGTKQIITFTRPWVYISSHTAEYKLNNATQQGWYQQNRSKAGINKIVARLVPTKSYQGWYQQNRSKDGINKIVLRFIRKFCSE